MYPGGQFVLNILADGNHMGLMKTVCTGEDRFAGVATQIADNGSPISVTPLPM